RKHFTDVAESACSKQCVGNRMAQDVAVGMSDESLFMRDFNTAKNERGGWSETMQVVADADAKFHSLFLRLRAIALALRVFFFEKCSSQRQVRRPCDFDISFRAANDRNRMAETFDKAGFIGAVIF